MPPVVCEWSYTVRILSGLSGRTFPETCAGETTQLPCLEEVPNGQMISINASWLKGWELHWELRNKLTNHFCRWGLGSSYLPPVTGVAHPCTPTPGDWFFGGYFKLSGSYTKLKSCIEQLHQNSEVERLTRTSNSVIFSRGDVLLTWLFPTATTQWKQTKIGKILLPTTAKECASIWMISIHR